ncbi:MAG: glycosyltransferase family protein, partial [bacterium]
FLDKNLVKQDKIVFVGTGDKDRFPLLHSISNLPVPLEIYGSYWEKEATLAPFSQGQAKPETIRVATTQSLISLCLVRRANRDGHVMRSFEIPPCGAAMLVEYTDEHAHIFGADGDCVRYFKKDSDLPHVAAEMLEDREQLPIYASKVMNKIISEGNTYQDRLQEMLLFA